MTGCLETPRLEHDRDDLWTEMATRAALTWLEHRTLEFELRLRDIQEALAGARPRAGDVRELLRTDAVLRA